jgi:Fe-S cluster biogenesis protein NfuA
VNPTVSPELEQRIVAALDEVRPMLQSDGGDLVYLGTTPELLVRIQLLGACRTCPSQSQTLKNGVEAHVQELVPEVQGLLVETAAPKPGQNGLWGMY